jgi:hypothetical protein
MSRQLLSSSKLLSAITVAAGAAAATAITGSTIDTQGFKSVLFIVPLGPIVAGAVTSFKIQHGDAADASDMADILSTNQAVADDQDNLVRYAELAEVTKRYCRIVVSRATQNATLCAQALLYNGSSLPATQTALGESINNPVSGTA